LSGTSPCPPSTSTAAPKTATVPTRSRPGGHAPSDAIIRINNRGGHARGGAERTCWHNCGSKKSDNLTAALPASLRAELEELYRPSEEAVRFHAATKATGGVTYVGW